MNQRIAINGFGRIGRTVLRAWTARESLRQTVSIAAINEIADPETVAHLTQYDSTHGRFPGTVARTDDALIVNGQSIALLRHTHIDKLPWRDLGIDLVIESTGAFSDRVTAEQHIHSGARRVLFSQPAQSDVDATIVWGLNQSELQGNHQIISAGSCTTNALCPVLKIIDDVFGIEAGTITTVNSAMNDQPFLGSSAMPWVSLRVPGTVLCAISVMVGIPLENLGGVKTQGCLANFNGYTVTSKVPI